MCIASKPKTITVEKPVATPVEAKVEKVMDPTPTPITPTDTGAQETRMDAEREKQRKKKGYASTRTADQAVLTDTAQSGGRQTLG